MTGTAHRLHQLLTRGKLDAGRQVPAHGHPRLRKRTDNLEAVQADLQRVLETRLNEIEARIVNVEEGVVQVEEGLQENRRLSLRVAELTDMVTVLIGAAARGGDEFRLRLDEYAKSARHD